jgi:hypothetical protein
MALVVEFGVSELKVIFCDAWRRVLCEWVWWMNVYCWLWCGRCDGCGNISRCCFAVGGGGCRVAWICVDVRYWYSWKMLRMWS